MAHETPEDLKYTIEHEWTKIEDDVLTVGISDFAQSSLGDIVFIELPETGPQLAKGESFGVVESIKSVSDLYSPITGTVLEANTKLIDSPEQCNTAPYNSWFIKIKIAKLPETESLLDATAYLEHCAGLE